MNKVAVAILCMDLLFSVGSVNGQQFPKDSILIGMRYLKAHPFDSAHLVRKEPVVCFLNKELPNKQADHVISVMLEMNLNHSLVCLFYQTYLVGKGEWIYIIAGSTGNYIPETAGIKNMNRLYRLIRDKNKSFCIPLLDKLCALESSGELKDYTGHFIAAQLGDSPTEYLPPLRSVIEKYPKEKKYGYSPFMPIKIGMPYSYVGEQQYLADITYMNNKVLSYRLIHGDCSGNIYKKITGPAALLDEYEIKMNGAEKPLILYFDVYHRDTLYCPRGFTYIN